MYNYAKSVFDASHAEDNLIIIVVLLLFTVVDMHGNIPGSVTIDGATTSAATVVQVRGIVFMVLLIVKVIVVFTLVLATMTTDVTALQPILERTSRQAWRGWRLRRCACPPFERFRTITYV